MTAHPSADQLFLDRLHEAIKCNLQNEEFGVTQLAEAAYLSKSQLNRKLHELTGQSPSQLIREYRLKKSLELLQSKTAAPTEVAYMVGFSSPSYFSTCFHEYYGYSPSEVIRKMKKNKKKIPISIKRLLALILGSSIILLIGFGAAHFFFKNRTEISEAYDRSIAILPFENLSSDPDEQYLADGVREAIVAHLSRIGEIKMRPEFSVRKYRDENFDLSRIADELMVNYLLEGSFQKFGDSVKLTAKLILAPENEYIWVQEYVVSWTNLLTVQREVAKDVANLLHATITDEVKKAWEVDPTTRMEAYQYYWKGRKCYIQYDHDSCAEHYRKALELDESFSLAHTGMGKYYHNKSNLLDEPDKTIMIRKAKRSLHRAIELDPFNAWAYSELAYISWYIERDSVTALSYLNISINMLPNDWQTMRSYFMYHFFLGNCDKVRLISNRMREVNGLWPKKPYVFDNMMLLECENRYQEIIDIGQEYWDKLIQVWQCRILFGSYIFHENYDEARRLINALKEAGKDTEYQEAYLNARLGIKEPALQIIKEGLPQIEDFGNVDIAGLYCALGEEERMYEHLEMALANRESKIVRISGIWYFYAYQDEPRFKDIYDRSWVPKKY